MPVVITEATSADVPAITSIFLTDGEGPSSLMQMCLGTSSRDAVNMRQADGIAEGMEDPGLKWLVARDSESKKTISFAHWQLPKKDGQDKEDAEMTKEEMVSH